MDIYCLQLGMLVEFSYCTSMNDNLPCRNILGCWKHRGDIITVLRKQFSDKDLKKVFSGPPKTKIERIIESLEKEDQK